MEDSKPDERFVTILAGVIALMMGNPLEQAWKYLDVGQVRGQLIEHCTSEAYYDKGNQAKIGEAYFYTYGYRVGQRYYQKEVGNGVGLPEDIFCMGDPGYHTRQVTVEYWRPHPDYSDVAGGSIMSPWQRFVKVTIWSAFLFLVIRYVYKYFLAG